MTSEFSLPPCPSNLDQTAHEFLLRIDALDEVTPVHYLWLMKHPEDKHRSIDDLSTEIQQTHNRTPFRHDSLSGTMRTIAQDYDRIRANAKTLFPVGFTCKRLYVFMRARWRIFAQVFRGPILLATLLATFLCTLPSSWPFIFEIMRFYAFLTWALFQLYTLFFNDIIFQRRWLGFSSKVKEGIYYNRSDQLSSTVMQSMEMLKTPFKPAFLHFNGDLATLWPALLHDKIVNPQVTLIRRWIRSAVDLECICVDIAFPYNEITQKFCFNADKPIVVIHHGLTSSSDASYVRVHSGYYTKRGFTTIAINARGFGDSFVIKDIFHGARTSDVELLVKIAHVGAGNGTLVNIIQNTRRNKYATRQTEPQLLTFQSCFSRGISPMNIIDNREVIRTPILCIGFSMGGIIVSNYVSTLGKMTGLTAAFTVGAYAERIPTSYSQAERDWEGILADNLKGFVHQLDALMYLPRIDDTGAERHLDIPALVDCCSIKEFDTIFTSLQAHQSNLNKYYHSLSFGVDYKLDQICTPLFILHPSDDPVLQVDSLYPAVQALLDRDQRDFLFADISTKYFRNPVKNLMIYIPHHGGHVGSYRTWNDKWSYLCELSFDYFDTILNVLKENIPLVPLPQSSTTSLSYPRSSSLSSGSRSSSQHLRSSGSLLQTIKPHQSHQPYQLHKSHAQPLTSSQFADSLFSSIRDSNEFAHQKTHQKSTQNYSNESLARAEGLYNPMHYINQPVQQKQPIQPAHPVLSKTGSSNSFLSGTTISQQTEKSHFQAEAEALEDFSQRRVNRLQSVPLNAHGQHHHNRNTIFSPSRISPSSTTISLDRQSTSSSSSSSFSQHIDNSRSLKQS